MARCVANFASIGAREELRAENDMDLVDLEHFVQLARTLHFGKTARERGLSASSLSRRMQGLEAELGRRLFLRDRRGVRLSRAGQIFRGYAQAQLTRHDELLSELTAEEQVPTGELNVACTVTACHTILPKLLSAFRERYPGIRLRLLTQDAARSRSQLQAGELDLAVIPTDDGSAAGLEFKTLATTRLAFIAPRNLARLGVEALQLRTRPSRRLRAGDLADLPLVAPIAGLERERLDGWLRQHELSPNIVAEVRGNEGIISMVSLGCGIGLVPELVLTNSPLRAGIQVLSGLRPPRGYRVSLCALPRSLTQRRVRALWELTGELVAST